MKEELIKYVMEKADQCYADDFPIRNIQVWIEEFFDTYQPERLSPEDDNNSIHVDGETVRKCVDASLSCYATCLSSHIPLEMSKIFGVCDSPNTANK